jgi:hypothetical protein
MKRLIAVLCAFAAVSTAAWAQLYFPSAIYLSSLQSNRTASLLGNEIDQSFSANGDFGSVANPFLLLGVLGNPEWIASASSVSVFDAGYYSGGTQPFSVRGVLGASLTGLNNTPAYAYGATLVETLYDAPSVSMLYGSIQGLMKISGITTGLRVVLNPQTTAVSTNFYRTIKTTNYNAGAVDYTTAVDYDNFNAAPAAGASGNYTDSSYYGFSVPLYLKTGDLEHNASVSLTLRGNDLSGSYSSTESAHAAAGGGAAVADIDASVTSKSNQTAISANYMITMPGFFGSAKGNKFSAGIALTDAITNSSYAYSSTSTVYDLSVPGAKTQTGSTTTTAERAYSPVNYLGLTAMAKHSLNFAPAQGIVLEIAPQVLASFSVDRNNAYANANASAAYGGLVTSYTSGATSQTTAYADEPGTSDIAVGLNLPSAFKIKPEAWPFGFFSGAQPFASFTWTTTTSAGLTYTSGATTYTTTSQSATAFKPAFGESHSFGIFIPFQGDIRADIAMNGNNLLAFDNLTLQLYVPLK